MELYSICMDPYMIDCLMILQTAVSMGTPIMHMEWVFKTWEQCNDIEVSAIDEKFVRYLMRLNAFFLIIPLKGKYSTCHWLKLILN